MAATSSVSLDTPLLLCHGFNLTNNDFCFNNIYCLLHMLCTPIITDLKIRMLSQSLKYITRSSQVNYYQGIQTGVEQAYLYLF